jgi:hypothetical protein
MFDKVIFFNQFGAGDIFESREFVKAWMKLVPADEYYYAHGKNPRILLDIPRLKYTTITSEMNPRKQIWVSGNTLFVNTWIGITGKYLLPGIGCTVERLYDMHNDMLRVYNFGQLSGIPVDYIPNIEYYVYDLLDTAKFLAEHDEDKIFIDNGLTQSLQAENFPMDDIIYSVARNHPEKTFIVTHPISLGLPNIHYTSNITKRQDFDLPEISYLSTFCRCLIGRNSGPHVFTQVKKNVMDENKKLLSFTYRPTGASFVVNSDVKIKRYWSGATDFNTVIEHIERIINE